MRRAVLPLIVVAAVVVAGCATPATRGPTFARNDSDREAVVRIVGTTGTVNYSVPAHSSVRIPKPDSVGTVTVAWMAYDDCRFKNGQPYGDGDGIASPAPFERGGVFLFERYMSFGYGTNWEWGSPMPTADATLSSICLEVPTPA